MYALWKKWKQYFVSAVLYGNRMWDAWCEFISTQWTSCICYCSVTFFHSRKTMIFSVGSDTTVLAALHQCISWLHYTTMATAFTTSNSKLNGLRRYARSTTPTVHKQASISYFCHPFFLTITSIKYFLKLSAHSRLQLPIADIVYIAPE